MGFSYKKAMELRPQKERWLSTFVITLLISGIVILPFVFTRPEFFASFFEQGFYQIPFYRLTLSFVGSTFIHSILNAVGYAFGSPVAILLGFVPQNLWAYVCALIYVFRFAAAALTAYFFIRRFTYTPEAARLGGILYAFCSCTAGGVLTNQLQMAVVLFPLVLLALENLLTENKRVIFALLMFLISILNPYATGSIIIFVILYFVIRVTTKGVKATFGRILTFAAELLLGVLAAALLLIPTAFVAFKGGFLVDNFTGTNAVLYNNSLTYLNVFALMFLPSDSVTTPVLFGYNNLLGAWLPVFSVAGAAAFCSNNKGSAFKRILIASLVISLVPALNKTFSLFNPSLGFAFSYMPLLIMSLTTVMALENREINLKGSLGGTLALTVIFVALVAFLPQITEQGLAFGIYNNAPQKEYLIRFSVLGGLAIISVLTGLVLVSANKKRNKKFFNIALIPTVVFSAVSAWVYIATEVKYFQKYATQQGISNNDMYLSNSLLKINAVWYVAVNISMVAIVLFIIYAIVCLCTKNKRNQTEYICPEGEALIEVWKNYDQEDNEREFNDEEDFSLESIAESLSKEYPVNLNSDEFKGGFNITPEFLKDIDN
ncbi:MAG: YfhO family protein [Clostridia bacterium]|nr:YfhO family protein [Clostridia bacterium]